MFVQNGLRYYTSKEATFALRDEPAVAVLREKHGQRLQHVATDVATGKPIYQPEISV